jgi:enoyl-CoA hydratase/carnithine racemase
MTQDLSSSTPLLKARFSDGIVQLTINDPRRHNVMTRAGWASLVDIFDEISTLSDVRLIRLQGAGNKAFIAGADISEFDNEFSGEAGVAYDDATVAGLQAISNCPFPTLAAIRGHCIGGGLGVALACDIRICSQTSQLGIPAGRLGLSYPSEAVHRLVDIVGPATAKYILFSAQRFTAEDSVQMGLVNKVVGDEFFDDAIDEYCDSVCSNAPMSLRAAKYMVDQGAGGDQDEMRRRAIECLKSNDYAEGKRAFTEKRPPVFKGN